MSVLGQGIRHGLAAAAALVGAPVGAVALAIRPPWREGLGERLGALPARSPGCVWIHGASVGESRVVAALAAALRARGHDVFATLTTPSGRKVLNEALPTLPTALAPLDHPWCVDRALARLAPRALVLVETELWPCLIDGAARRGVRLGVVSGRLSETSVRRYGWAGPAMRGVLRHIAAVGARTSADADRFVALGLPAERVTVTGDLKLAPRPAEPVAPDLEVALAGRSVFVAGSTHPGEEEIVVQALARCELAGHAPTLVVAPRRIQRAPAIERALELAGRRVRRRTRLGGGRVAPGEVLLLDTIGELRALYAVARVAFIGGTLTPVGGHDPLEAVLAGCPVCIGPRHQNVSETVERLVRSRAAHVVADADELALAVCERLKADGPRLDESGVLRDGAAALEQSLALVEGLLDPVRA